MEALQEEKESLQEELRQHRMLGTGLEALVQDRCRPNEREKYRVFTGSGTHKPGMLRGLLGAKASPRLPGPWEASSSWPLGGQLLAPGRPPPPPPINLY